MKFFTREWAEEVKKKTEEDAAYLKNAKGLSFKALWVATSCPGGTDREIEWEGEDGKVVSVKFEEKPSPSDLVTRPFDREQYFIRTLASYDTYAKIISKQTTVIMAAGSGAYKIEGDMVRIKPKLVQFQVFYDLCGSVPTEY